MGKVRKNLSPFKRSLAWKGISITAPYLFKEHREGKKGEKILVPVRFSRSRPGERGHRGETKPRISGLHSPWTESTANAKEEEISSGARTSG